MLTRIEVLNYQALRYIKQSLEPFQVLIGPNASGKSTFLDVISLVASVVTSKPITETIRDRAPDIRDLTWMRSTDWFEIAVEAVVPTEQDSPRKKLRYEFRIGIDDGTHDLAILAETLWFISNSVNLNGRHQLPFPEIPNVPERITVGENKRTPASWRKIVNKTTAGNDYFKSETTEWNNQFRLGPKRSALANLPEDETRFPAAIWFKRYISEGVQRIMLNSEALRKASPPQSRRAFLPDGSNLPWVIHNLEQNHPAKLREWIAHVQTALNDVRDIRTLERPDDRHRYLVIEYDTGLQASSWTVSDGTLRMLALTILAYLPDFTGIYLIEEPENGIYPRAVETVYQSLSSVYSAQVLVATHSPIVLSLAQPKNILCFARTPQGETDIVRGDEHPALANWQDDVTLDTLFASGVLG
jgi:energy-coupling factor transporter ATP-binding protein EcfA2